MVKYDEIDGDRSGAIGKSVKKVEESSKVKKSQRPEKLQMLSVWRNQAFWLPTLD